jgi:hypothetical protein
MLTPDTEALITHHKVRVDAANSVRTTSSPPARGRRPRL